MNKIIIIGIILVTFLNSFMIYHYNNINTKEYIYQTNINIKQLELSKLQTTINEKNYHYNNINIKKQANINMDQQKFQTNQQELNELQVMINEKNYQSYLGIKDFLRYKKQFIIY